MLQFTGQNTSVSTTVWEVAEREKRATVVSVKQPPCPVGWLWAAADPRSAGIRARLRSQITAMSAQAALSRDSAEVLNHFIPCNSPRPANKLCKPPVRMKNKAKCHCAVTKAPCCGEDVTWTQLWLMKIILVVYTILHFLTGYGL